MARATTALAAAGVGGGGGGVGWQGGDNRPATITCTCNVGVAEQIKLSNKRNDKQMSVVCPVRVIHNPSSW